MALLFTFLCLFLSLPFLSLGQLVTTSCPLLGPDFPPSVRPSASKAVIDASKLMLDGLKKALQGPTIYGSLDPNATSYSMEIYSLHDADSLFTYHIAAPELAQPPEGVAAPDSNTVYRIGSVSKLLTVYVYLIEAGDTSWNDPITKYVPELAKYATQQGHVLSMDVDSVNWEDITVGALASQLSGIGRDAAQSAAYDKSLMLYGLPPVTSTNASFCGTSALPLPCDRAAFFDAFFLRHPVVAPSYTPSYSNAAYTILGFALENVTGHSLSDLFTSALVEPLDLKATSFAQPQASNSSLIPGDSNSSFYNSEQSVRAAAGGYYSSINDMTKIGRSILNSSFLTPGQTNRWFKPRSFSSNPNMSVGAPWEITRAPGARVGYIYAKNGGLGAYHSEVAFWPDYDAAFTVFAAGKSGAGEVVVLSDLLSGIFYPALEAAAKEEADAVYSGLYQDPTGVNSSITIVTDDRPGLGVSQWTFNGTDGFAIVKVLNELPAKVPIGIRLYPTGLKTVKDGKLVRTAWRAVLDVPSLYDPGAFSPSCQSWAGVDVFTYGGIGFDEFLFNLGGDGRAVSVEPRVLQQAPLIFSRKVDKGNSTNSGAATNEAGVRHILNDSWSWLLMVSIVIVGTLVVA